MTAAQFAISLAIIAVILVVGDWIGRERQLARESGEGDAR